MKRPALLVGIALAVVALGAAGAWLTLPSANPQPRLSKAAKAKEEAARSAAVAASAAASIAVPEAPPPPEPTMADFTHGGAPRQAASQQNAPQPVTPASEKPVTDAGSIDWAAMPIDELRSKANADDVTAMEELARRLLLGEGVAKDQQAGAGWLLRAAQRGSAQAAFNVGVMYERGFVVERDSTKAIDWYRRAAAGNLPMAKHNLALLLRDGKGAPRNGKEAVDLLRSAARQGMSASMFTLGDIYERGDGDLKDPALAFAWFAIAAEFERQTNHDTDTALGKLASQRAQALQRILLPGELERAQQFGQAEFKAIVEALQPPKPAANTADAAPPAPAEDTDPNWPKAEVDQVRVIQQALVDLKFLRDKPDGVFGPMTRNAIRAFQRGVGTRDTGEPNRETFAALQAAIAKAEAAAKSVAVPATPEPPPPPTSGDITRATAAPSPAKDDPDAWPTSAADQVKAIQTRLQALGFSNVAPDGQLGPMTRAAIRDFEKSRGLAETGEPTKALFDSLKEGRASPTPGNN
jgi:TPR repeat protein/peptidoglycan hydrolase-like protein with peptidoglycan-binding domain